MISLPLSILHPVDSPDQARAFLAALHGAGLLYHPEESAHDSLQSHALCHSDLQAIESNMCACFDHLTDPCDIALEVSEC